MSDENLEVNAEHMALANICINLACAVSDWPPEIADKMMDLRRRFSVIQATLLERQRVFEEQKREQEQREAEARRAEAAAQEAVHPKPDPSEFDLESAIRDAEDQVKQLSRSFSTSRGENEGVFGSDQK